MTAYRRAVGANSLKSVHVTGSNTVAVGTSTPFEAYVVFPDQFLITTISSGTEANLILNGDRGWRVAKSQTALIPRAVSDLRARYESILSPVKFEHSTDPRRVMGVEKIDDESSYVVESRAGAQTERLYFNVRSGLLCKQEVDVTTWLGTKVEETTFEDYRDVHGVKLPFLITRHYMEDQSVFTIAKIQINLKVDPAKFEPPAK